MRILITAVSAALILALYMSQQRAAPATALNPASPVTSTHSAQSIVPTTPAPLPPQVVPAVEPKHEAAILENEIADLNHEIEQGRYVERINDPGTPDHIKKELRDRLRLMVHKTLALTHLNMKKIDEGNSI